MKIMLAVLVAIAIGCGLWAFKVGPLRDPAEAMRDFLESGGRAEDQLTDPLVLAGPRVRPLVLSALADRQMSGRRYALAYLGCTGYKPAQETLLRILSDDTERDYFRSDALEALWRLDPAEGEALALTHRGRAGFLGETATHLLASGPWAECRSWFAAFTGRHD